MKVAIAGFGIEGQSSLEYFSALGHEVVVLDEKPDLVLPNKVKSVLGSQAFRNLSSYDLIVRSAGLPPNKLTEFNDNIDHLITTQLNEFLKVCPSQKIIGVTGTKGKGTTATLIAKMLAASNRQVVLGGNIGVAMLSLLPSIRPETFVVLELSSFQLSDLKVSSPKTAVCLMVVPEHLDWHGSLSNYIAAKTNLFAYQPKDSLAIFYPKSEFSRQITAASQGQKISFFEPPGAEVKNNQIVIDGKTICSVNDLKLIGQHNWQNICAAVTAVWQHVQDVQAAHQVLTSFSGLEHRLEFVREVDHVKYYNDSFASQLKASEAAILAIKQPKVLIIGGFDRMLELESFCQLVKKEATSIRKLMLIGASAERVAKALEKVGYTDFYMGNHLKTMADIVNQAKALAKANDAVVLSPGFPSFDMFKNFEDRGNQFKDCVKAL